MRYRLVEVDRYSGEEIRTVRSGLDSDADAIRFAYETFGLHWPDVSPPVWNLDHGTNLELRRDR